MKPGAVIKLLLIEDDEDDFIITRDLLEDTNFGDYNLDWENSIDAAKAALAGNTHDVCLLDYSLGAEDGVSLLKQASRLGFKGPIIMLTGQDNEQLDSEALSAGAVDYLVKSQLSASRLARAIRYAIARKEMETERVERLRAESENRSKSEFLAHLSHELRTPLTAILGYTDLMMGAYNPATYTQHLNIIKRNGHHLLSLLNDVLDLSKIEAGKLDIECRNFQLNPFIADIYHLMKVTALDKDIEFDVVATKALPIDIYSDPTRLRQILLNIIGNAIKFTDQGGVKLFIDTTPDTHELSFTVVDTGIGISTEDQKRLFQPFSQAGGVNSRSEQGTGLGLAISRQLSHKLSGNLTLSSEPGCGSTLTLTIPLADELALKTRQLDLNQSLPLHLSPSTEKITGRILIADDLEEIRSLVAHLVRQAGAEVVLAADGREAIEQFHLSRAQNKGFDLILLDMQMPRLSGIDVTRQLRMDGFDKPIIALTAATMQGQRQKCLDAGCTDHLGKPIDRAQLIQCINHHLTADSGAGELSERRLLLVEDNKDAREVTTLLLESLGWKVSAVEDGHTAIKVASQQHHDVILMDIHLPDISGYDAARKIKKILPRKTRLIALSGESFGGNELNDSVFDQYIMKPIDIKKLSEVLS